MKHTKQNSARLRSSSRRAYFLAIDVGTGSARAGIFDEGGRMVATASNPISMWKPAPDHVEQSSDDIWRACCVATRAALQIARLKPAVIKGVGFAATCSLVVLDKANRPLTVSTTQRSKQNVIVWMDHRAQRQAESITRTGDAALRYVGGTMSPEMQLPKLLWLKQNLPETWRRAAHFLDLADYLTFRATGDNTRSLCTTVCKWTYLGHRGMDGAGWSRPFFKKIGLGDLASEEFNRIGDRVRPMGEAVGRGISEEAAAGLGLVAGTPVGVGVIDAHAGGIGLLGARIGRESPSPANLNRRLALIGGTSSCHMAVSPRPRFIRGIWGPYFSAMIPEYWLTEGGQSASGSLIDHVMFSRAQGERLKRKAIRRKTSVYELLNASLATLAKTERVAHFAELTRELHVQPDFHGNRSPRADATLKGVISGLTLSDTEDDLARLYLAAIQAVAYGTRHIVEEMNRRGYAIDTLIVCGGGAKNPVFLQEHANATGCRLVLPREKEAVLLGAAILGAVAARQYPSLLKAMRAMTGPGAVIRPASGRIAKYHNAKYRIFHRLHREFLAARRLMSRAWL